MHFPRENKIFVVLEHVLSTHALPSVGRHLCLHRARNSGSTQCLIAGRVESPDFDDRDVARQATELLTVRYFCIINTHPFRHYAVSFHRIKKNNCKIHLIIALFAPIVCEESTDSKCPRFLAMVQCSMACTTEYGQTITKYGK